MFEEDNRFSETITASDLERTKSTIDVERLGRERPIVFRSTFAEVIFIICVLTSLAMAEFVIGGFQIVLPTLIEPLNIPENSQTWPANVLTLVAGAFLFPMGRMTDMYGGYAVFNGGTTWFAVWTIIAGFSCNFTMLVVCRAMQGLGASAFLPAGISILGKTYRPGPRKNLIFSLYGALAPLGFFSGIIIGGMTDSILSWKWYFLLGGMISGVCTVGGLLTIPNDFKATRLTRVTMDWWGLVTIVPGLMLVIYAITDSPHAPGGWASPQIIVTLVVGVAFLCAATYVEGWVAENPLIPAGIFAVKYMKRVLICLFLTWGAFSMFLFYSIFYIELVVGRTPLMTAVWFSPWVAAGVVLALASGFMLHVLPGQLLLIISGASKVLALALFAFMPEHPAYWPWVFPAMVAEAACVDVLWTVSNVYLTTSLPQRLQGFAGALISVTLFIGGALLLAISEVVLDCFDEQGLSLKDQYQGVFKLGLGFACVALVICFFIRLDKAGCALTVDEKTAAEYASDSDTLVSERLGSARSGKASTDATRVSDSETTSQAQ